MIFVFWLFWLSHFMDSSKCGETGDSDDLVLFDFSHDSAEEWTEQSDTRRRVGMSKAVFVTQHTDLFRRAVFFSLLNPQSDGAAFAGTRIHRHFNLSEYKWLQVYARGQGENINYKMVLRHRGQNDEPHPTYEQFFSAPYKQFDTVVLPLQEFKPFYRGRPVPDAVPLDTANITCIGLQIYGGVYSNIKQSGAATLEVDFIKASSHNLI